MDQILGRSEIILDEQQKMRELLEDKIPWQKDHMAGRVPTLHRIEDLLLRLLVRSGDSEILDEAGYRKNIPPSADGPNQSASAHSRFSTDETDTSVFSSEDGLRAPPPPGSLATSFRPSHGDRASRISSSLLVTTPRIDGELDENREMQNLPDGSPPPRRERNRPMPPDLPYLRKPYVVPESIHSEDQEDGEERYATGSRQDATSPTESIPPRTGPASRPIPVAGRPGHDLPRTPESSSPTLPRPRTHRPGPVPEPLNIPSPVMPGRPSNMAPSSFRPSASMSMPMPRPSRLAGTREPMTTT